jgi:hypothetical protein
MDIDRQSFQHFLDLFINGYYDYVKIRISKDTNVKDVLHNLLQRNLETISKTTLLLLSYIQETKLHISYEIFKELHENIYNINIYIFYLIMVKC